MPTPISNDPSSATGGAAATATNIVTLGQVRDIIKRMRAFVDQVYVPDTLAIASFYKDWFFRGEGLGNFMTYGDFPSAGQDDPASWLIPSGVILNRDLSTIHEIDLYDPEQVQEFVGHSWYDYEGGKQIGLHPHQGETNLNYTGPKPPYEELDPILKDWVEQRKSVDEIVAAAVLALGKGADAADIPVIRPIAEDETKKTISVPQIASPPA